MDVRTVAPRDRHPLIFDTFDALKVSEAFVLINDHDPKPLYYQLLHERTDQFDWQYLQEGPEEWHVQITRIAKGD
ncbi:MAG: DUF2249 domain-containing protein [Chloroflexi bacterium]|nr:DUF2249 domain-containing protein [Chloroflexota bacterium]